MYCKAFFLALASLSVVSIFIYLAAETPLLLAVIGLELVFISLLELNLDWIAL